MNGAHDLGGMMGFGPVQPETNEPVFHASWEARMMALALASAPAGGWNIDASRFAREDRSPREYLNSTYYELWYKGLVRLMQERGMLGAEEVAAGRMLQAPVAPKRVLPAGEVWEAMHRRVPYDRPTKGAAAFSVGDRVRTHMISPKGHTRLPRYVRGKIGTVEIVHGAHVLPDSNAHGGGETPQFLYTVAFKGPDLWGAGGDPDLVVSTDCWESYLERA